MVVGQPYQDVICDMLNEIRATGGAVSPPSSRCTPSLPAGRTAREAETSLALCKHSLQQLKHRFVIITIFIKNQKQSITQRKLRIQAKNMTVS